ncbi:Fic family protein [Bradyrhizobium sp. CIAT3101]|uniref:Fic family protein n=1 Tax=Bradyrhizobium sp. CIAT3101 TaxID=439387 RepID=UPI0024B098B5|nr:Fic family protein [Bradyrhizobium sp. CIAT3101]WFU80763.1 Fic family protein [Bradyrhizobium sp. CIAT3101]
MALRTAKSHAYSGDYQKLFALAHVFCWFGEIHPFLDGNGHVQRAIFATMAVEFGFPISARFSIHPRPFGRLLALPLELFTRASNGEAAEYVAPVVECLGFFLGGPFDAPRRNLPGGSIYD